MTGSVSPISVDVIVPTFNNLDQLRGCLEALALQATQNFRVLVCVDGSTDGTLEFLQRDQSPFPRVVLTHPDGRNPGAVRRGISRAVGAGGQDRSLAGLGHAVAAERRRESDVRLLEDRDCASVGDVHYENADDNPWARYLGTRGKNKHASGSVIRPLDFVTANSAMRTERLQAVGGFDVTLEG